MKNVDKLAQEYNRDPLLKSTTGAFKDGYNAAIKNLKQIVQQLQKEQITSTVYILREVVKRMEDE